MSDPATAEEYHLKATANIRYSGHGPGAVMFHMPCPFCAEPDFAEWRVIETAERMQDNHTCKQCGRSSRAIVTSDDDGSHAFEIVQTGGADPPAYLPKMRRVET
jgi:hypothetical protein